MIQQSNTNHLVSFKHTESLCVASNQEIINVNANVASH